ncbi:MAG: hypothetical protein JJ863_14295 [Deltaproteobacteria bacterium]|nr:hypothetical protein [Deltaproteobacteria bacterium]
MSEEAAKKKGSKLGTVLGWLAGALALLLVNFFAYHSYGDGYPVEPTSFGAVVVGAFGGMAIADRLGARAPKILGLTVGLLLGAAALTAFLVFS